MIEDLPDQAKRTTRKKWLAPWLADLADPALVSERTYNTNTMRYKDFRYLCFAFKRGDPNRKNGGTGRRNDGMTEYSKTQNDGIS